jgi:chorismate mutase/prephenate dehydrogenase
MFGPDVELLSGRHVLFVDVGHREALESARALFNPTMAEQAVMTLDEHDRLIAYVLGLSHAVNIAFFTALAESGESAPQLLKLSSTTFDAQLNIARNVASESAELYFEIQHLNDFGAESLNALARSVEAIREAVRNGDETRFTQLMHAGREYTKDRRTPTER